MSRDNVKCGFQVVAILKSNMADAKREFQVAQYLKCSQQHTSVHLCQIWCLYHKMHNRFATLLHYVGV